MEIDPKHLLFLLGLKEAEIFLLRDALAKLEAKIKQLEAKEDAPS